MISAKVLSVILAIATTALSGSAVTAATLDVTPVDSSIFGDATGHGQWRIGVSYTNGTDTRDGVMAGALRLNGKDQSGATHAFLAFCLSPFDWLNLPKTYTLGTGLSAKVVNRLSALANGAWSQLAGSRSAGAFQLAAWEIVSEGSGNALNLGNGDFRVTWASKPNALTLAQQWLDAVSTGDGAFKTFPRDITILSADNTQDLLTRDLPSQVPLPGALGFLVFGLAATAAIGRGRRV